MKISIFLPLRAGSTRVIRKNTRPFSLNGESLFQLKMNELVNLVKEDDIHEIIISTNDDEVIRQSEPYIKDNIKLIRRPDDLCKSTTKVQDLINYVPSVVEGDHVFWIHVTSPFVNLIDYKEALSRYKKLILSKSDFDSIMSVNKLQQFIWDDKSKGIINIDRKENPWPNTQDLAPLYEINHAFYISKKENYFLLEDRIGKNPDLFICEGIKKIDIDWEDDFMIAEAIVKSYAPPHQG